MHRWSYITLWLHWHVSELSYCWQTGRCRQVCTRLCCHTKTCWSQDRRLHSASLILMLSPSVPLIQLPAMSSLNSLVSLDIAVFRVAFFMSKWFSTWVKLCALPVISCHVDFVIVCLWLNLSSYLANISRVDSNHCTTLFWWLCSYPIKGQTDRHTRLSLHLSAFPEIFCQEQQIMESSYLMYVESVLKVT